MNNGDEVQLYATNIKTDRWGWILLPRGDWVWWETDKPLSLMGDFAVIGERTCSENDNNDGEYQCLILQFLVGLYVHRCKDRNK